MLNKVTKILCTVGFIGALMASAVSYGAAANSPRVSANSVSKQKLKQSKGSSKDGRSKLPAHKKIVHQ